MQEIRSTLIHLQLDTIFLSYQDSMLEVSSGTTNYFADVDHNIADVTTILRTEIERKMGPIMSNLLSE
jgi:hypothetical protein